MINALHDEIDAAEDFRAEATAEVEKIRAQILDVAGQHDNFEALLEQMAQLIEAGLSGLTTRAAVTGYKMARARPKGKVP